MSVFEETGDVGEVWYFFDTDCRFGEDTAKRVVSFIRKELECPTTSSILDIGTGNAYSLRLLVCPNC